MDKRPHDYRAYLLRLWLASNARQRIWHASLETPQTGERLGFASLEQLFAFLREQTAEAQPVEHPAALDTNSD